VTPGTEPVTSISVRARRLIGPLSVAGACLAGAVALHARDPHESGSWGYCPFLLLTGHSCPGCGGLRAVNDLTHFDLVGAASSNLLFVASLPFIAYFWLRWASRAWTGASGPGPGLSTRAVTIGVVLLLAFWLVRNLAFGAWLAP
jgi:hypothetical protein